MADISAIMVKGFPQSPVIGSNTSVASTNTARAGFILQNQGTNPLYVLLGTGATTSNYSVILKGSTAANDGTGGILSFTSGITYQGAISVAGTSPSYSFQEL